MACRSARIEIQAVAGIATENAVTTANPLVKDVRRAIARSGLTPDRW